MIRLDALQEIKDRFEEINRLMAQGDVATDPQRLRELGRERTTLEGIVQAIDAYERTTSERDDLRVILAEEPDAELTDMARTELETIEARLPAIEADLRLKMIPKDPEDARMRSSKFVREPAGTRPGFSPAICTACIRNSPRAGGGRSKQ